MPGWAKVSPCTDAPFGVVPPPGHPGGQVSERSTRASTVKARPLSRCSTRASGPDPPVPPPQPRPRRGRCPASPGRAGLDDPRTRHPRDMPSPSAAPDAGGRRHLVEAPLVGARDHGARIGQPVGDPRSARRPEAPCRATAPRPPSDQRRHPVRRDQPAERRRSPVGRPGQVPRRRPGEAHRLGRGVGTDHAARGSAGHRSSRPRPPPRPRSTRTTWSAAGLGPPGVVTARGPRRRPGPRAAGPVVEAVVSSPWLSVAQTPGTPG